jgi:hypothetical protein
MNHLQTFRRAALVLLVICPSLAGAAQAENRLLWQIGSPDGSYREFAIAGRFADYPRSFPKDVTYLVGRSKPGRDWPYIHPGPSDPWAGARPHPFRIDFDLAAVPTTPCRLNVYLVDARHEGAQVLEIDINGRRQYRFAVVPGVGEGSLTDPGAGRQSAVEVPFSPTLLQAGRNRVTLTVVNDCWLLYDAVSLETGSSIPSSPELVEVLARLGTDSVAIAVDNIGAEGDVVLGVADRPQEAVTVHAAPGPNTFSLPLPAGLGDRPLRASVTAGGQTQTVDVQSPRFLWRIGKPDGDYHEFAIAGQYPEYSRRFPGDVTYNVDTSRPDKDWPFIHPGPSDAWAGTRPHPFRIDFGL